MAKDGITFEDNLFEDDGLNGGGKTESQQETRRLARRRRLEAAYAERGETDAESLQADHAFNGESGRQAKPMARRSETEAAGEVARGERTARRSEAEAARDALRGERAGRRSSSGRTGSGADASGRRTGNEADAAVRKTGASGGRNTGTSAGRNAARRSVALILLALFLLGAVFGVLGSRLGAYLESRKEERIQAETVTPEQERLDGIRQSLGDGRGVLETLRKYYPDDIVLYSASRYHFYPIDRNLKQHAFLSDKVRINTDGTWGYVDGDLEVKKGIDVSSFQGEIDWEAVAGTNVQFAIIRALYRGYETGKLVEDKQFRANLEGAQANGIETGVYIFTQAVSKAEVDEELSMLIGLLGAYDIEMPVVVDVEDVVDTEDRMDGLTKEERTEITRYYCDRVAEAGYRPMIYYNINGAVELLDLSLLEDVDKWFAVYDSDFYYPYAYQMWQYKDTGRVAGIEGNVDLDLYFPTL